MKTVFLMMLVFLFMGCNVPYKFNSDSRIGVGGKDKEGNSFFCVYDQKTEEKEISAKATCSFTAIIEDKIFECKEISLSKISKNFSIKSDCVLLMQID